MLASEADFLTNKVLKLQRQVINARVDKKVDNFCLRSSIVLLLPPLLVIQEFNFLKNRPLDLADQGSKPGIP